MATCRNCQKQFERRRKVTNAPFKSPQVFCSRECSAEATARQIFRLGLPAGTVGAVAELLVCADLLRKGWHVFRAVSPACPCDIVGILHGHTYLFEVRTGQRNAAGKLTFQSKPHMPGVIFAVVLHATQSIVYFDSAGRIDRDGYSAPVESAGAREVAPQS